MKNNSRCTPSLPSRSASSLLKKDYSPVRPLSSLSCKECEKQQESIEQLKYMLYSTEKKLTLTEKHIKLYEKVMEYKDNQADDSSISLIKEKHLLEGEKRKLLNLLTKTEDEKTHVCEEKESTSKQRSKTFYDIGSLDHKKLKLGKYISKSNKTRESLEPDEELASFHMDNFMTTEASQFQRFLGESNNSSDEFNYESSYKPLKPQKSCLSIQKATDYEYKQDKSILQETHEHFVNRQSKSLQNLAISSNSLKNLEKLKIRDSQRHLSHKISSPDKLNKNVKTSDYPDKIPQTISRMSFLDSNPDKKYRMSADTNKNILNINPLKNQGECTINNIFSICDTDISLNKNDYKRKNPFMVYKKSEEDTSDNYQNLNNELKNIRAENEVLKNHLEKYKEKHENIFKELKNVQNDYRKSKDILGKKESELDDVIVELNTLKGNWRNTLAELKQAKIEIITTKQTLKTVREQGLSQSNIDISGLKEQIIASSTEITNLKNLINMKNKEIEEAHNNIYTLKLEIEYKNTELSHAQYKLSSQESDNNSLKIETNLLKSELLSCKTKISALKQELTQTKNELSTFDDEKLAKIRVSEPAIVLKNEQELNDNKINNLIIEKNQLVQKVMKLEKLYEEEKEKGVRILEEKNVVDEILKEKEFYFKEILRYKKNYEEEKGKNVRIMEDYEGLREKNVFLVDEVLLARDCGNISHKGKGNNDFFTINMGYSEIFNTNANAEKQTTHEIARCENEITEIKQKINYESLFLKQKTPCDNCLTLETNLNTLKANYENLLQTLKTKTTELENLKAQNPDFLISSKPSLCITLTSSNQITPIFPIKSQPQNNFPNLKLSSQSNPSHHPQELISENSFLQNLIISLKLSEASLKSEIECLHNELTYTKSLLYQATTEFTISINPIIQNSDETNKVTYQKSSVKNLSLESELKETRKELFTARNELMSCQAELMKVNSDLIRTECDLELSMILIDSYKSDKGQNTEILKLTETLNSYKNKNSVLMLKINELQNYITRESQKYKQELEKTLELQDKREKENLQLMIQIEASIKTQKYQNMLEKKMDIEDFNEENQDLSTQNELLKRNVKMLENQLSELYANHQRSKNQAEMYRILSESLHTQ
ncbi:hypothetical protein SteCoe_12199 [Stentor coeruleus]|uniref:Uncharacterized protein n=1 Tax=Stentor coeruleus TaxID=5963 RepID=A0A1R2CBB4_9CILI|nr:hypothetical protein SteCoe_12199 [Stentor coeruleus]